jgi:hypothetical protein
MRGAHHRVVVFFAVLVACASASAARLEGEWGGEGQASLSVEGDVVQMSFPCAAGRVDGAIPLDGEGRFDVPGTYTHVQGQAPAEGPRRPSSESVRFRGRVNGDKLALSVHFTQSNMPAEHFALTRGAAAHVPVCGGAA